MPKIIENLEKRLLSEAKKQIEEVGFGAMTIRSVAKACGVGVGTVYNYFASKEEMVARCLLGEWMSCIHRIQMLSDQSQTAEPVVQCIYEQLREFASRHQAIFQDEAAAVSFAGSFGKYHGVLRKQLAQPLRKFCESDFTAEFAAEALLTWSMSGVSFSDLYGMIKKLF